MANIDINELNATGSDLFNDTETYLQELTKEELGVQGGLASDCMPTIPTIMIPDTGSTYICSTYICSNCTPTSSPLCAPPTIDTAY